MRTQETANVEHGSARMHWELTQTIIGVFYDVYNELGHGFLESVYEECMVIALRQAGLKILTQVPVPVFFRGQRVGEYKADLLVEDKVLVELKTALRFEPAQQAQLLHYLKATEIEVGLLLNFGPKAEFRRLVFENSRKQIRENPRTSAVNFCL